MAEARLAIELIDNLGKPEQTRLVRNAIHTAASTAPTISLSFAPAGVADGAVVLTNYDVDSTDGPALVLRYRYESNHTWYSECYYVVQGRLVHGLPSVEAGADARPLIAFMRQFFEELVHYDDGNSYLPYMGSAERLYAALHDLVYVRREDLEQLIMEREDALATVEQLRAALKILEEQKHVKRQGPGKAERVIGSVGIIIATLVAPYLGQHDSPAHPAITNTYNTAVQVQLDCGMEQKQNIVISGNTP